MPSSTRASEGADGGCLSWGSGDDASENREGENSVQRVVSQATEASGNIWEQGKRAFANLAELGQHLPEQGMQCGELSAQVDVTLKATAVGQCV